MAPARGASVWGLGAAMTLVPPERLLLREHGPRLLGCIALLWDPPCAPPVPGDAGMPVPACPQRPALSPVPEPGRAMEEPAGGGTEPWAEGLRNSNNNASPGGWPGTRGGHPLAPFGVPGAEPSYLGRVVLEIVESERTYARDLRSIVEGYLGKIIDTEEPVLRPEQVSALFGNIEDIYELSSTLLQNLESCASDPVAVAVCFVTRSQEFAIYTQYCNNYPSSVAALAECMRSKPQARFLRECQERLRHALPLGAYLLKPVQRILKYHLLLQEIAKHFEHKSGDDYEVVLEAIDTMTCVAWYINDMKRKHEHAIRQQEIQSLLLGWKGPDLTSYGELVLEGTFRVQRVRHERAVFLFDKTLLITKRRGDHYVYKSHIPCSSLMLIESTRDSLCFSLAHYKHGKQQHSLQAKSVEEKRVWTHHIKRLILENHHAIIPQKAKEAILEMDLFYPPRLPRCSPERLKKSWSCQPLGDTAAEPRQGRRQSEPFQCRDRAETLPDRLHGHTGRRQSEPAKQILRQLGEQGLKHAGSDGALLEAGDPPQHPRSWAAAEGVVEEEEEEEEEEEDVEEALGKDYQEELPGARDLPVEPQEEQAEGHPPAPEGPKRPSSWGPGSCEKAGISGEHPEGLGAPEAPSSAGTPVPALPGGEGEQERAAEDLQGLSSEEEEEEEEGAADSILPPSVLDQASVIAERFGGGGSFSRRSSLALEGPVGRPASRSGSALSLDGGPPLESGEPGGSHSTEPEPLAGTRRESLLSSRDRLLLDKIKSYYGQAEHRDAGFSVRRRESLSFIPKGLVRSSVSRLNGLPRPPASPEPPIQPAPGEPEASPEEPCRENGLQPPEPLLIVEEDDPGAGGEGPPAGPPPRLLLTPPHPGTKVYQLARQYSLRIKSRRAGARRAPVQPEKGDPRAGTPSAAVPKDGGLEASPSPAATRSPSSPSSAEPFAWPDVRELRARFGAPRPPPVSRSRSAPEGPRRGGRPAEKERGSGRSRSAEAGGGSGTPEPAPARHSSDGALWVAAEAPLGSGQRVLVLERLPAPAEPPAYVQIRSPTTREKICLKAVVERCKAYQASEEYRRRCPEPPTPPSPPKPPRHGLVRDLRQKFQTLDAAS
ncbi:LOW QUALITY PROTEIN: pleckstrin homology domain-containing family G member 3 [Aquila chrysaetos chrysaetos]|uniref:LOW QUALITY PROTEIN: pleckstrin homology domain-containing family G member 3 n=1 Tax=Aquila chrysaetos chrysaetos TaxID=223781 RepID=UPI0011765281|nr:LOW QUALITY PROTEIN: pleckstrin homology domain-containing family G member 3 [Aquila chrysaetos chrysaetos]